MNDDITEFIRCKTCGRYVTEEETYQGQFCSRQCSLRFGRCLTCARSFSIEESDYEEFCSEECYNGYHTPLVEVEIPQFEGEDL